MIRKLQIPDTQVSGFQALLSLDEESFQKTIERVSASEPTVAYSKLPHELAEELSISRATVFSIVNTLVSLHDLAQDNLVLPEELASDVAVAVEEKLHLSPEAIATLQSRIEYSLRKTESLAILVKARNVLIDNQRTFLECRILSDIRSVYTGSPESEPAAAVILHTLKLVYWNSFQKEEFFVTLDTGDLKELRAALERAEKKTLSLSDLVLKTGLHYIDLSEE